jgi:hypothetical protein
LKEANSVNIMSENVFYETKQLRVTDKLLMLKDGTTLSTASISSVMLRIVPRGGLLGLVFGDRTARLFIELNTGIVHELASEDVPEVEKMKAAIEKAIAAR